MTDTTENKQKQNFIPLVIILLLLAAVAFSIRFYSYNKELTIAGDSLWHVTIDISGQKTDDKLSISVFTPLETENIKTIQRNLYYPGFKIKNIYGDKNIQNSFTATSVKNNAHDISIEYLFHLSKELFETTTKINKKNSYFLKDNEQLQITHPIILKTLNSLLTDNLSKTLLVNKILSFISELNIATHQEILSVPEIISEHKANKIEKVLAMVSLCRAAGIPARAVTGLLLVEDINPTIHYRAEVFIDKSWQSYDPNNGYGQNLPSNFLPIRIDDIALVEMIQGELKAIEIEIFQELNHPILYDGANKNITSIFDLRRLPFELKGELATLLLLPFGILITALCRHIIGVHSYGVFTPTLLALALTYADPYTTSLIFLITCSFAVMGRRLFPKNISHTPRLAIIFTLVSLIIASSVSILNFLNIAKGSTIILLPIIILTTLVDRIYRTQEDEGLEIAIRRLIWTIIISFLCLPIIQMEMLGNIVLKYPEIHLISLALFLLLSNYKGKKLINLAILKILAEPVKKLKQEENSSI